jgi:hypothetical protein
MVLALLGHSSWLFLCLCTQAIQANAKTIHLARAQIHPQPFVWLACESATDRSSRTIQRKSKTATHCQSGSCFTFFLSGCGLNSQRRAETLWIIERAYITHSNQRKQTTREELYKIRLCKYSFGFCAARPVWDVGSDRLFSMPTADKLYTGKFN